MPSLNVNGRLLEFEAEPCADASDEATAIELHLMQRAAGMPVETPAVRP